MIGKFSDDAWVVVRSVESGVWLGQIVAWEGAIVTLTGARRAHYWARGGSCSGLAVNGPGGDSRICPPVDITAVLGVCEVNLASPQAVKAWLAYKPWSEA